MQDMTSPIQPEGSSTNTKKRSCWLYGLAVVGGCTIFLFFVFISFGAYMWFVDPFGMKDFFQSEDAITVTNEYIDPETGATSTVTKQYSLEEATAFTADQIRLMRLAGIDMETLMKQDRDALEACATAKVGAERVSELERGEASPTLDDFLALKACLE